MASHEPVDTKQSFPELEQRVLARWQEAKTFERQLAKNAGAEVWSFYEGPPTANGMPGSHHVLSRVFKDVYPRYRAMCGYDVPRKAGWDCHGLPVELEIEKELGISSKEEIEAFGIAEFNARCRESVLRYVDVWNRMSERIGFWVDLENPYVTMDTDYIESVWWSLRQLYDRELLYEGHKVVPYCPRCGTALSSHEVALGYKDVVDPSVYVRLPVTEAGGGGVEVGDELLVWTTTPWTLISHAAVAVGAEITYVRARAPGSDGVVVVAEALAERVLGEGYEVVSQLSGAELEGSRYEAPFDYIPGPEFGPLGHSVLIGGFVTTDDGTGLVHTALAFGEDDYRLGEANGMTLQNPVKLDGTYDERVPDFQGKLVYRHNPEIVEALDRAGKLYRAVDYEHSYPHCWRCDTALIYYAKASWYIRTTAVRERMLAENERIGWRPESIKHGRFGKWLEGNVDWALSRDRYWGTPLPIWECERDGCEGRFCAGSIAELRERGAELDDQPDLHRPYIDEIVLPCESCDGSMRRVEAVIDTWYDSGAVPFAQHHYPFEGTEEFERSFPAQFICEAIDQTRGWFYSQLAESVLLFDQTDYLNCVCLGLILDPEGRKMSKRLGNLVDPFEVIDAHGADAFRWYYLASQPPWAGYRFSADTVGESVRRFLLTLWNTYAFYVLYANAEGVEAGAAPAHPGTEGYLSPGGAAERLDRWAISRLQATTETVRERLDDFDSTAAGKAIAAFVDELSNWYVRVGRRRFWEGDAAAFGTLRHCLVEVSKLLAPFTPFVADAIWANLSRGEDATVADSVHLENFPEPVAELRDPGLERGTEAARRAVELGRAARAQAKVKMRQPLAKAVIVATSSERETIESFGEIVRAELNVRALEFVTEEGELATYTVKPNYRTMGPRFGKQMPQAAAAVEALDPDHAREAIAGTRELGINLEGSDHTVGPDDLSLVMQPLAGYQVESEAGRAVALSLELDDELVQEGLAREVVRAVQNARKESGLEVTDRIELRLSGDEQLLAAAEAHRDYIAAEVLADGVELDGEGEGGQGSGDEVEIDGKRLAIAVARG